MWYHGTSYRGRRSGKAVRDRELQQRESIPSRVTQRESCSKFTFIYFSTRTVDFGNLTSIETFPQTSNSSKLHFGIWNAQSVRGKVASLCDVVVSNKFDILAITESWLNGNNSDNTIVAGIKETLQGYKS